MAKASPMVRSFNAGEFSELLTGRVDLDRYPASLRSLLNFVAAPQGPAIARSGTTFVAPAFSDDHKSTLVPFVFSPEQTRVLEFTEGRIRFFLGEGLQVYAAVAGDVTSSAGAAIVVNAPTLGADVDDEVVLSSFPVAYNLNGEVARVTAKVGTSYTLSVSYPAGVTVEDGQLARVYHVACDYTQEERESIRVIQSVDVLYLLTGLSRPLKLSRYDDYDWRLEDFEFVDGPYMPVNTTDTVLTPSGTGNGVATLEDDGVTYVTATLSSAAGSPIVFTAVGLDAEIGQWVTFKGFSNFGGGAKEVAGFPLDREPWAEHASLNGVAGQVTAKTGTQYTVDTVWPSGSTVTSGQVAVARAAGRTHRGLVAGSFVSDASFLGRDLNYELESAEFYKAFDDDDKTYWAANETQLGDVIYVPETPFVADGYTIYTAKDNQDTTYASRDFAPSTFTFQGYDGAAWVVLDRQDEYVLYEGGKSVFIEIPNTTAYEAYRLQVSKIFRNGPIEPRVRRLVIREKGDVTFTLVASATSGINADTGFQTSDVGRLIRLKGEDGAWRACRVVAVNSTTSVDVSLAGEPLLSANPIREWRLGYWSDTTGWPNCGDFFEDRLWLAGSQSNPDLFAGSVTGAYETFSQTDPQGVVLDDSAVVGLLNARSLSRILWMASDAKGLLVGTGSGEYTLAPASDGALTARNAKARPATRRGSAPVEPIRFDNQIVFVQRGGRQVREFAFVFESDGYKAPSMSQLASHIGAVPFVEMAYAQEPHGIVWFRQTDGSLCGMTYNRDENVVGWHRHDLAGAYVESIKVVPQADGLQDALWLSVVRVVNGETKRYIERLTRFWDFDTELSDAHFVDCALRYNGSSTNTLYGLRHLEGEDVYGLADGNPIGPLTVENGAVVLEFAAENVVIGLGFESRAELQRLENGAADGTAQGKVKRINNLVVSLWRSAAGAVGVYNEQKERFIYEPLKYPGDADVMADVRLYTGLIGPVIPSPGYDQNGYIAFVREKHEPLPFNIVALMPQLNTQDR